MVLLLVISLRDAVGVLASVVRLNSRYCACGVFVIAAYCRVHYQVAFKISTATNAHAFNRQ